MDTTKIKRREFIIKSGLFALALSTLPLKAVDFSKIKIGFLPISDHLLIISKELYQDNFTSIKFNSWAELSEALRAKSIDAAFMLNPLALRLSTQIPLKALMATHRNGSALMVRKDLENISDLKGKKIAIPSRFSTHYLLLYKLLSQNSIAIDEVKLIDMAPPEMPFSLKNGGIDAFLVAEPFGTLAKDFDFAKILRLSSEIEFNHTCCQFVVSQKLFEDKQTCQNLVSNFIKTAKFIQENPKEASLLGNKMLGHKKELLEKIITNKALIDYSNLRIEKSDFDSVLVGARASKIADFSNTYENFVDNSFIDKVLLHA